MNPFGSWRSGRHGQAPGAVITSGSRKSGNGPGRSRRVEGAIRDAASCAEGPPGMTEPRIVRAGSLVPAPWPNGRGVTREIAGLRRADGSLVWSLSLADLTQDAPFSHLPQIDRTFTLVEGDPVVLACEGFQDLPCGLLLPIVFPGERPVACRLTGRPAKAFNVMVDRRERRGSVRPLRIAPGARVSLGPAVSAILCVDGALETSLGRLEAGDTFVGSCGEAAAAAAPATLVVVEIAEI